MLAIFLQLDIELFFFRLELKRERRKTYNAKTSVKESLWKDNKKMEELKQQKLLCQFCGKQFSVVQGHLYWEHMNMHQVSQVGHLVFAAQKV